MTRVEAAVLIAERLANSSFKSERFNPVVQDYVDACCREHSFGPLKLIDKMAQAEKLKTKLRRAIIDLEDRCEAGQSRIALRDNIDRLIDQLVALAENDK